MKAYVETFGCQMNESDSERILYLLEQEGYKETDNAEDSDIIVINTCTVREKAKNKLYGHLGNLKRLKTDNKNILICVGGCASQDLREKIIKDFPFVDIVFGTHNINELPDLIKERILSGKSLCSISESGFDDNMLKVKRRYSFKAYIPIIIGCDNYCSFCIVPRVRGREISVEPEKIIEYAKEIVAQGVYEITLLGQNVNSYGKNLAKPLSFSELLKEVSDIEGLKRLRFTTSNPKDFSEDIIRVMKSRDNIAKHIHLPFQSGSNKVLKKMNRKYTREDYLNIIDNIKKEIPECSITTDIMIGFPGEEKKDFIDTLDLIKQVRFSRAFTFIYSPRNGTRAAKMDDYISINTKKEWFNELVETQNRISYETNKKFLGKIFEVLVEGFSESGRNMMEGRMEDNTIVNFEGRRDLIGKAVSVFIKEAKTFYLMGKMIK
jgi:tRNA-2-methylthio-N6-dimethylallyladenosine synthase